MPFLIPKTVFEVSVGTLFMVVVATYDINGLVAVHNGCVSFWLWDPAPVTGLLGCDLIHGRILFGCCCPTVDAEDAPIGSDCCAGVLLELPGDGQLFFRSILLLDCE